MRQKFGSYRKQIIYIPLYYVILTVIIAKVLDSIFDNDAKIRGYFPYIKGALIGLILSGLGRYYWHVDELMGLTNANMLHIYIPILYLIVYGFIIN